MDFAKLETIVSQRKLPPTDESKKKRRRINPLPVKTPPTALPVYTPPDNRATIVSVHTPPGYPITTTSEQQSTTFSATVATTPPEICQLATYNTSIGFLESTLIVKQRFKLSEEVYILVGLSIDEGMRAIMYIIDKRLWMQIEISTECLTKMINHRQEIDSFFQTPVLADQVFPLYTKRLKIQPSISSSGCSLNVSRYRDEIPDTIDWENNACWHIVEEYPVPVINVSFHEWCNLALFAESIIEYFNLCSTCTSHANLLMKRYVNDFKALFRPTAVTAASMQDQQQQRIKEDLKLQLQLQVRNHHYTRLVVDVLDYERGKVSPLGAWLDAELRSNCYQHVTLRVINELSKEFDWLKD